LFNGVKSVGKDEAITYLRSLGYPLVRREAKGKLHALVQEFFCISPERYWEIYEDRYLKEKPLVEFTVLQTPAEKLELESVLGYRLTFTNGHRFGEIRPTVLSVREAMIYVSEVICKPRFHSNYFGVARAKAIREDEIAVDSSTGFVEELPPLIERLGQENILLIRVHREGATFEGDSRNYIPDGVITNTVDVNSVYGFLDEYLDEVKQVVTNFIGDI
jgi:hypothetical protein